MGRVVDVPSDATVDGELSETDDRQSKEEEMNVRSLGDEPFVTD